MKIIILYRPESEHARNVETYVTDYNRFHPDGEIETLSLDTREGSEKAKVYGIQKYPAVLAVKDDGAIEHLWEGEELPLMNDLAYYANQ